MKISLRLFLLVTSALLSCAAHAATCNQSTITGHYAFEMIGAIEGQSSNTLFLVASDGKGNLSGTGAINFGGAAATGVTLQGTYKVTSTCTFTATTTDSLDHTIAVEGQILQGGAAISGLSTTSGTFLQYNAYRQSLTTCNGVAAGTFSVFGVYPSTPAGPFLATAQWVVTKAGIAKISQVLNVNGTVSSSKATATISMNPNCTFTWTVNPGGGTLYHAFGVGGINQDGIGALAISTDDNIVDAAVQFE